MEIYPYTTNWRENAKILEEDILEEAMSRLKNYSKKDTLKVMLLLLANIAIQLKTL